MKYIHKCNLSRIVLIFTRATCCLLYLCVIDTTHRSGNSKLNFATANFHVTATFQIHYFSFPEWLFCVARTTSFFSTLLSVAFLIRKFLIRRVACFIMFDSDGLRLHLSSRKSLDGPGVFIPNKSSSAKVWTCMSTPKFYLRCFNQSDTKKNSGGRKVTPVTLYMK